MFNTRTLIGGVSNRVERNRYVQNPTYTYRLWTLGFDLDNNVFVRKEQLKTIGLKVVFPESRTKFDKIKSRNLPFFHKSPDLQSFVMNASLFASRGVSEILKAIQRFYVTLSNGFMNTRR